MTTNMIPSIKAIRIYIRLPNLNHHLTIVILLYQHTYDFLINGVTSKDNGQVIVPGNNTINLKSLTYITRLPSWLIHAGFRSFMVSATSSALTGDKFSLPSNTLQHYSNAADASSAIIVYEFLGGSLGSLNYFLGWDVVWDSGQGYMHCLYESFASVGISVCSLAQSGLTSCMNEFHISTTEVFWYFECHIEYIWP